MRGPICLIVPVKDEADNLRWLLPKFADLCRIIVVDYDSQDGSGEVARAFGAELVRCPEPGLGHAIFAALCYLRDAAGRIAPPQVVVVVDADGSFLPADIESFVAPVMQGESLIVFSKLDRKSITTLPWFRRLGQFFLNLSARSIASVPLLPYATAIAIDYDLLRTMELEERRSGWLVELRIKAALMQIKVSYALVSYKPRRIGYSKLSGSLRHAPMLALRALVSAIYYSYKARCHRRSLNHLT